MTRDWLDENGTLGYSHQYIMSQDKHDKIIYASCIKKRLDDSDINDNYLSA